MSVKWSNPDNYLSMTLDGIIFIGLFEHEILKDALTR